MFWQWYGKGSSRQMIVESRGLLLLMGRRTLKYLKNSREKLWVDLPSRLKISKVWTFLLWNISNLAKLFLIRLEQTQLITSHLSIFWQHLLNIWILLKLFSSMLLLWTLSYLLWRHSATLRLLLLTICGIFTWEKSLEMLCHHLSLMLASPACGKSRILSAHRCSTFKYFWPSSSRQVSLHCSSPSEDSLRKPLLF